MRGPPAGALNPLNAAHRRDALRKSSRAAHDSGPLPGDVPENDPQAPLQPMTMDERLTADYGGAGINIGRHPMFYHRAKLNAHGVTPAAELRGIRSGKQVPVAGNVIVGPRPGTARGSVFFISIEDETGIANAVVMPDT
jgi:error-prone DNA polymerase